MRKACKKLRQLQKRMMKSVTKKVTSLTRKASQATDMQHEQDNGINNVSASNSSAISTNNQAEVLRAAALYKTVRSHPM